MPRYDGKYDASIAGWEPQWLTANRAWAGITAVSSNRVDIATTAVGSDYWVFVTPRPLILPCVGLPFAVTSINPGVGFSIGQVHSFAMVGSGQAHWFVARPAR